MHIEKLLPLLIAIAIFYFNYKKKKKKNAVAPKPETGGSQEVKPSPVGDFTGSLFKGFDDLFNFTQPEVQVQEQPKAVVVPPEQKKIKKQPVKDEQPVVERTTNILNEVQETQEGFNFDPRRAIIEAEIINRKYFSILSSNQAHDFKDRHF